MPELPEVETIRRGLDRKLRGARIETVAIHETRLRRPLDAGALRALVGRVVQAVSRRAKYLLVDVGDGLVWLLHLGMSGRVVLSAAATAGGRAAHDHVVVGFGAAGTLTYSDPRRFGLMRVGRVDALEELAHLGPEPLDEGFDGARLRACLRRTRRDVKAALLDQRVVAGIGNIYASEILFRAGVRPTRRCHRLRRLDVEALARETRAVLAEAVERRGTSFSDYFDSDGAPGTFQEALAVFDRGGEACRRCAGSVRRRVQGGRSSFYCPRCQR